MVPQNSRTKNQQKHIHVVERHWIRHRKMYKTWRLYGRGRGRLKKESRKPDVSEINIRHVSKEFLTDWLTVCRDHHDHGPGRDIVLILVDLKQKRNWRACLMLHWLWFCLKDICLLVQFSIINSVMYYLFSMFSSTEIKPYILNIDEYNEI